MVTSSEQIAEEEMPRVEIEKNGQNLEDENPGKQILGQATSATQSNASLQVTRLRVSGLYLLVMVVHYQLDLLVPRQLYDRLALRVLLMWVGILRATDSNQKTNQSQQKLDCL